MRGLGRRVSNPLVNRWTRCLLDGARDSTQDKPHGLGSLLRGLNPTDDLDRPVRVVHYGPVSGQKHDAHRT